MSTDGSRGDIIIHFKSLISGSLEWNKLSDIEFAMWLSSDDDLEITTSPVISEWAEIYALTRNYWSYIAADFLKTLGHIDEKTMRITLPEEFQAFAFTTSESEQVILSLSQEKGIRVHFAKTTPLKYKLDFLKDFKSYCRAWKELIDINNARQDEDLSFNEWWELALKTVEAIQQKEQVESFGKIMK